MTGSVTGVPVEFALTVGETAGDDCGEALAFVLVLFAVVFVAGDVGGGGWHPAITRAAANATPVHILRIFFFILSFVAPSISIARENNSCDFYFGLPLINSANRVFVATCMPLFILMIS